MGDETKHKFNPGDLVCLKSDGPKMTVERYVLLANMSSEDVQCSWMDGSVRYRENFAEGALEKIT